MAIKNRRPHVERDLEADALAALHPALSSLVRLLARQAAQEAHGSGTGPHPPLFTLQDTADALGVSLKTVRRRIDEGLLPVVRDGRVVRVHPDDLHRYVDQHRGQV